MMAEKGDSELTPDEAQEEFAVWKKNTPLLYDFVISHPLEWPSLTVHWAPLSPSSTDHRLVLGTHTADGVPNYLMIADAVLPAEVKIDGKCENSVIPNVEIVQMIHVDGEVNRARCMPQLPTIVAAKTSSSEVYVFRCIRQAEDQQANDLSPALKLRGHDNEGYGLSWNQFNQGLLLSGSHDSRICLWNVSAMDHHNVLDPLQTYNAHESVVEDVSWHSKNENLFGSVGDDCRLMIWDLRTSDPQQSVIAHDKEINGLSFNCYNEWMMATASSDTTVGLLDMRKMDVPLHILSCHTGEVFQVEWDPNEETVLASCSDDRRLNVWDLRRIGEEQSDVDADDGPPELLFSHGGHKAKISDFSWNKLVPRLIASVADDNCLQVWRVAESIYHEDD